MNTTNMLKPEEIKRYQSFIEKSQETYSIGISPIAHLGLLQSDVSRLDISDDLITYFTQAGLVFPIENEKCSNFKYLFNEVSSILLLKQNEPVQAKKELNTLYQDFMENYQERHHTNPFNDLDALNSGNLPTATIYSF